MAGEAFRHSKDSSEGALGSPEVGCQAGCPLEGSSRGRKMPGPLPSLSGSFPGRAWLRLKCHGPLEVISMLPGDRFSLQGDPGLHSSPASTQATRFSKGCWTRAQIGTDAQRPRRSRPVQDSEDVWAPRRTHSALPWVHPAVGLPCAMLSVFFLLFLFLSLSTFSHLNPDLSPPAFLPAAPTRRTQ